MTVFNDMKVLLDTTVNCLEEKHDHERYRMEATFDKILRDQRHASQSFKSEFASTVLNKVNNLETFSNDLALEQAKILEKFISINQSFDGLDLFPKSCEGSEVTEKA